MLRIDTQHTNSLIPLANQTSSDNAKTENVATQGDTVNISDEGLELSKTASRRDIISNTLDIENYQANAQNASLANIKVGVAENTAMPEKVKKLPLDEILKEVTAKSGDAHAEWYKEYWTNEESLDSIRKGTEELNFLSERIASGEFTREEAYKRLEDEHHKAISSSVVAWGYEQEVLTERFEAFSDAKRIYEEEFGVSFDDDSEKYYAVYAQAKAYGEDVLGSVTTAMSGTEFSPDSNIVFATM